MSHRDSILGDIAEDSARSVLARFLARSPAGGWYISLCGLAMLFGAGLSYMPGNRDMLFPSLLLGTGLLAFALLLMMKGMPRSRGIVLILAPVALAGGFICAYTETVDSYEHALERIEQGRYEDAQSLFESLDNFRDSKEMVTECTNYMRYESALESLESSPAHAYYMMHRLKGFAPADEIMVTPAFQAAREKALVTGKSLEFGRYDHREKANGFTGSDTRKPQSIVWDILARDGDRALLISRYVLDVRAFHDTVLPVTWADSELRRWLNGDFLSLAFTAQEQSAIDLTTIDSQDGQPVQDRLFLMSYDEVYRYMPTDELREAKGTPHVTGHYNTYDRSDWLLRRLGQAGTAVPCISRFGDLTTVNASGTPAGIRPAMWVTLSPEVF